MKGRFELVLAVSGGIFDDLVKRAISILRSL
jgi:hypothetical protein